MQNEKLFCESFPGSRGVLVISLDFELYWGLRDTQALKSSRHRLISARIAIRKLLELFRLFDIHATWAIVGFLFFANRDELLRGLPDQRPMYINSKLSPYLDLEDIGLDEETDPFHYAPSLIRLILSSPNQEIATHTFSHYLCLEEVLNSNAFRADLAAAFAVAEEYGVRFESVVFPKNQYNCECLQACKMVGLRAFRGNPQSRLYRPCSSQDEKAWRRIGRFVDTYINLSGHHCCTKSSSAKGNPMNVAASRFLRPYSRELRFLEPLKIRRITNELENAANKGAIYHLWWHPHNFGANLQENMSSLRKVLDAFAQMRTQYGMRSLTMAEVANGATDGAASTCSRESNAKRI